MVSQNKRLFPKKYAHNYYVLSRLKSIVNDVIKKYIDGNAVDKRLIDYGCGDVPYLPLFADKVARYVTCDIGINPLAEVTITPEGKVPLPDESFDIVLSSQVLEHVDDVNVYLAEANRLLDKDGLLLLSTHGQWIYHPIPRDLWRWTNEGLTTLLEKSGFKVIETMWFSGMLAYSSQLRLFYIKRITQGKGPFLKLLFHVISFISNFTMPFLDKLEGKNGKNNAAVYFVVARKNLDNIEKITTIYGQFYSRKGDLITNQLKQYSAHTRNELAMLKSLIRDGDNIIDVGAHIGTFAIPFATFNKGKGKIFSFEADTGNYNLLRKNIRENFLDDIIIPTHAIASDIKQKFSKLKPLDDNSGAYCFVPDSNQSEINKSDINVINIDDWYEHSESETRIDVIKIDVEGAEMAVLRSCELIIKRYNPLLYIEISREALERFNCTINDIERGLKSFGYHFFKNVGPRNSDNDIFKIKRLNNIEEGGNFFDLLAIHPSSHRYPEYIP